MAPSIFHPREFLISLGERFLGMIGLIGGITTLALRTLSSLFRHKLAVNEFFYQLVAVGNRSISIVWLIALFTGMVFSLQLAVGLGRFGLKMYIGQIIGIAIFRELGPVLTSLMIAARVGSGIAAELGSMVVTEQVLAIEAMGANPIQKLVVPRLLATLFSALILTTTANLIGLLGGALIAISEADVTLQFYFDQIRNTVILEDFTSGIVKAGFFGFVIAIIACYHGLTTSGGTEGVGESTTRSVVHASITVFILDLFLTKLFLVF
ncbi:MAG: ABC transporter permease [Deltaproteobacteria bacterium]|nr:ABC transporter permease [Deltaproteobacteria bacterium]